MPDIPKPRLRSSSETQLTNFSRYQLGNFGLEANWELGVKVFYEPRGIRIAVVRPGSPAESAGLLQQDLIMECNGVPVGIYRDRVFALWKQYERSENPNTGVNLCEFSVVFVDPATGFFRYYFPQIELNKVAFAPDVHGNQIVREFE